MREFGEQLMSKPSDNLDFSHKQKRSHTIEKPHPAPMPVTLQEWLVRILQRLMSVKAPAIPEENKEKEE
jgi:hypothetical protein